MVPNIWTAFPAHLLAATNTHFVDSLLGIAIPDCFSNPGISGLKNANPRIPGLNPGIESSILN